MAVLDTVSDSEDTVVEVLSASGGDDTTSVALEDELVGLDGNGDWSLGDGSLELGGRLGDVLEASDLTNTLGFVVLALSSHASTGGVWVIALELKWVGLDVLEGVVHKTTVAALVNHVAVDELLLGEGLELAGGKEFSTLDGTGGGESPAGTALTLVLNWGDGTLGDPVDGVGEVGLIKDGDVLSTLELVLVTEESLVLRWGPVRHVVDTDGGHTSVLGVVVLDLGEGLGELSLSELELGSGSVGFTVLSNVLDEFVVLGGESLVSEELGTLWSLVVEGDDGKSGGGAETGDGGLSSHLFCYLINYK